MQVAVGGNKMPVSTAQDQAHAAVRNTANLDQSHVFVFIFATKPAHFIYYKHYKHGDVSIFSYTLCLHCVQPLQLGKDDHGCSLLLSNRSFLSHQIGRSTESPIDFVVTDTVAGSQSNSDTQSVQSTISRFACRIMCQRTPPYTARIYAAGFDSSKNIFLGVKALFHLRTQVGKKRNPTPYFTLTFLGAA